MTTTSIVVSLAIVLGTATASLGVMAKDVAQQHKELCDMAERMARM